MSKRPQSTPPPGRPGKTGPARRDGAAVPYKRPVQSPEAETVMLAQFTADPEADRSGTKDGHGDTENGNSGPPAAAATRGGRVNGRWLADFITGEFPAVSTRILTLPRGRHGGPAAFSEPSARRTWVSRATLAAILCVQAILSLRLQNTAYGDEGLYLYGGHMEIAHLLHGAALQGNYASYFPGVPLLYPVLGAAANNLGGLATARAISLLAMLITTGLLYSLTRRLFNERVGLCAAVLFSVTEGTILAGRLATNDAVSLCLLAVASWMVVRTASWRWRAYLLAMPVACLAAATDYWALLYLPTIALLAALAAHPHLGRPALVRAPVMAAIMVEAVAAGVLVAGRDYVTAAVAATASRSASGGGALQILSEAGKWGGLIAALAVLGVVGYSIRARNEPNENISLPGTRRRRIALGVALAGTALLTLADQLYLNTDLSLDTHLAFGLFFAAPMAGMGLARLVGDHFRRAQIGVVVWAVALILGLAQSSQLYGSWPNSTALVGELGRLLGPKDRYLVEDDNVAIYYLTGRPDAQPDQFTSTYFMSYRTPDGLLIGTPAYLAALRAGYFNVVIYDSTVTPALDRTLSSALESDPRYRLAGAIPEDAPDFHATCYIWVRT
jgi:Dolichyl-phosphate-mannose-protein mannosyltransferase